MKVKKEVLNKPDNSIPPTIRKFILLIINNIC